MTAKERLEAIATRILQAWQQDAPALALYQPRFLYVAHDTIHNLNPRTINTPTDRFNNVADWMISTAEVTN